MSRAACRASVASVACSEPTCLCASPLRLRMKTSHNGMFGVVMMTSLTRIRHCEERSDEAIQSCFTVSGLLRCARNDGAKFLSRGLAALALLGIGKRCLAHPRAVVVRLAPRCEPVAIARAVAGQHLVEFFPVD